MQDQTQTHLLSSKHWLRLLFMIVFVAILNLATLVLWAVVIFQFIHSLFTGDSHDKLRKFGSSLSQFLFQLFQFLTYNTEDKPFPFADWPDGKTGEKEI